MSILDIASGSPEEEWNNLKTLSKLAENAECFADLCDISCRLAELAAGEFANVKPSYNAETKKFDESMTGVFSTEMRNQLSVGFKNVVGNLRSSIRSTNTDKDSTNESVTSLIEGEYKQTLVKRLEGRCSKVLKILEDYLLKKQGDVKKSTIPQEVETNVFYLKMSGDYERYLAEAVDGDEHNQNAEAKYKAAMELAEAGLTETSPTRLGLALNYSVCLFEIMKKPDEACRIAKSAFDNAIQKLDTLTDNNYKDSTLIMQLLRDNLTLWTESGKNGRGEEAEED